MNLPELDPLIHSQVRLSILSLLCAVEAMEFTHLRDQVGTTDGNLSVHLTKLEEGKYITIRKEFVSKKPKTFCKVTERGKDAFITYLKNLKILLGKHL